MPDWLAVIVIVTGYGVAGAAVLAFKAFVFIYIPYRFVTAVMKYWVDLTRKNEARIEVKVKGDGR